MEAAEEVCEMKSAFALCRQRRTLAGEISALEDAMPENLLSDRAFRRRHYVKYGSGGIAGCCILAGFLVPALVFVTFFRYEQSGFVSFGYVLSTILCGLLFRFLYIQLFHARHKDALEQYHQFREKALRDRENNTVLLARKEEAFARLEAGMRQKNACAVPEAYWDFAWLLEEYVSAGKAKTMDEAVELLSHDQRYVQRPKY